MSFRARIERYYRKHPNATQEEVRRNTGASEAIVRHVFRELRKAGRVRSHKWKNYAEREQRDCSAE